ncbi:hypothetical protein KUCAC02_013551, partial [Chaenocephalus aceratus]
TASVVQGQHLAAPSLGFTRPLFHSPHVSESEERRRCDRKTRDEEEMSCLHLPH